LPVVEKENDISDTESFKRWRNLSVGALLKERMVNDSRLIEGLFWKTECRKIF
jgi:hypothetical protein